MPAIVVSIGQIILLFSLIFYASSVIQAVVYKGVLSKLIKLTSNWRNLSSSMYLLYALVPVFIATLATVILFNPNLIPNLITPHCHAQNCQPHTIVSSNTHAPVDYLIVFITAIVVTVAVLMLRQIKLAKTYFKTLDSFAKNSLQGYKIIQSDQAIAWCAGLLKPQVFISNQLLNTLNQEQLTLVLAHELSHKLHKDNLKKWLVSWLVKVWPSTIANKFYSQLNNTVEIEADVRAIKQVEASNLELYQQTIESFCQCSHNQQRHLATSTQLQETNKGKAVFFSSASALIVAGYACVLVLYFPKILHPIIEWLS